MPAEAAMQWVLALWPLVVAIPAVALLFVVSFLQTTNIQTLYYGGLGLGCMGVSLLFLARWPLYKQGRFFSFGPGGLSSGHRKLYWLAYSFVVASVLLLAVVWRKVS
jgi:hypothetical protein